MARATGRLFACAALGALAAMALPTAAAGAPAQQVLIFTGRGWGHGVGMAQDSAYAMGEAGASREAILEHFYPGTSRGDQEGTVRVDVWEAGTPSGTAVVSLPSGGLVAGGGHQLDVPTGDQVSVAGAPGRYLVQVGSGARTAAYVTTLSASPSPVLPPLPSPTVTPKEPSTSPPALTSPAPSHSAAPSPTSSPAASLSPSPSGTRTARPAPTPSRTAASTRSFTSSGWVTITPKSGTVSQVIATGRSYRGSLVALAANGFRLVNVVGVEDYLRGMGEILDPSWPAAALQAQAVAARTYALLAASGGDGPDGFELCDDARCQVYLGAGAEYPAQDAAVADTAGEVVTYDGTLADTFYSANAGGKTASTFEAFGSDSNLPYLLPNLSAPGTVDPWRLSVSPAAVAARLGYPGTLSTLVVSQRGPSGRATEVTLTGSAGTQSIQGAQFAGQLGLRSTLFSVTSGQGVAQALPVALPSTLLQLPPQHAAVTDPPAPPATPAAAVPGGHRRRLAARYGTASRVGQLSLALAVLLLAAGGWLGVNRKLVPIRLPANRIRSHLPANRLRSRLPANRLRSHLPADGLRSHLPALRLPVAGLRKRLPTVRLNYPRMRGVRRVLWSAARLLRR